MSSTKVRAGDVGEKKSVLEKIVEVGKKSRQLGLYLYIVSYYSQHGEGADLGRLHRFYNTIAGHAVHSNTVSRPAGRTEGQGAGRGEGRQVLPEGPRPGRRQGPLRREEV